jgi:hypothetical protein
MLGKIHSELHFFFYKMVRYYGSGKEAWRDRFLGFTLQEKDEKF